MKSRCKDNRMTIGVIGLGSMGKRRIRLLKEIDNCFNIVGIDGREDRRSETQSLFHIDVYDKVNTALAEAEIDTVIVSSSPASHNQIINTCLKNKCNVFSELNLIDDGYDENIRLAKEKNVTLFLSSTMMYRKEIEHIKKVVSEAAMPVNYIYHVGQFLPTWHSWESYKDFFVANKRTNGCREVFAIELPWLVDTFGEIDKISVEKGNMTNLNIDYPDNYVVTVTHKSGTVGSLNVNIASRYAVRNLEIYGQDTYIKWGGKPDSLEQYDVKEEKLIDINPYDIVDSINKQNESILENAYEDELRDFLKCISDKSKSRYSFEKDKIILSIIDMIEGELYGER